MDFDMDRNVAVRSIDRECMLYTERDMICFLIYPLRIAASTLQQGQQARIVWDPFQDFIKFVL